MSEGAKMKAVVCPKYGPAELLKIMEVAKPVPKDNELLVKIIATTVHIGDTKVRRFAPGLGPVKDFFFRIAMRFVIGFFKPRKSILGMEFAGEVESVGKDVTLFKPGDAVFASTEFRFGGHAEYCCIPEKGVITHKPVNMTYQEAAPVSNGSLTALIHMRRANVRQGHRVLIYGASGSIGTYAIQMAKNYGAEVTAVCSAANHELVKSLGADKVIDYTRQDFTQTGEKWDLVYDTVGKIPRNKRKVSLTPQGKYISALEVSGNIVLKVKDLIHIKELIEADKLKTVIDREYSIDEIVEAHKYVEKGHKKGNVVINVA